MTSGFKDIVNLGLRQRLSFFVIFFILKESIREYSQKAIQNEPTEKTTFDMIIFNCQLT